MATALAGGSGVTGAGTASGGTVTWTVNTTIPVGSWLLLAFSGRWVGTFSGNPTIANSKGDAGFGTQQQRASTYGLYFGLLYVATQLVSGDTVTFTRGGSGSFSTSSSPVYPALRGLAPDAGYYLSVVGQASYPSGEVSSSTLHAVSVSSGDVVVLDPTWGGRSQLDVVVAFWSVEGNAANITTDPSAASWTQLFASVGGTTVRYARMYMKAPATTTGNPYIQTSTPYNGLARAAVFDELLLPQTAAGSGVGQGSATSTVTLSQPAASTGSGQSTATAVLKVTGSPAGIGTGTGSAAAVVTTSQTASGTGAGAGSAGQVLTVARAASGSGTGQASATARPSFTQPAAGSGSGTCTTTGTTRYLHGPTGTGTGTGSAAATPKLTGAPTCLGLGSGNASQLITLSTAATGSGDGNGQVLARPLFTQTAEAFAAGILEALAAPTFLQTAAGYGYGQGSAEVLVVQLRDITVTGRLGTPPARSGALSTHTRTGTFSIHAHTGSLGGQQ